MVDASVALKWAVNEPGSTEANDLLDLSRASDLLLVAPEHILGEIGNGLRKQVAQQALTADSAVAAMVAIHEVGLELVAGAQRWVATLADALCWTVTTYDALYVRLALDLDCELVTADRRLVQAGRRARLPVVALHEPPPRPIPNQGTPPGV